MTKKAYFISDAHLGIDLSIASMEREKMLVRWLKSITPQASHICLVGDLFDYWFEYRSVVPKGFVRLFGTLADICDQGIEVHFFKGNHDMWMTDYFETEIGMKVHDHEWCTRFGDATFYIRHGDGLGPGNGQYNLYKRFMRSRKSSFVYSLIHPRMGLSIMRRASKMSRDKDKDDAHEVNASAIAFCESLIETQAIDYFVMGHSHKSTLHPLSNSKSYYVNLGDWMTQFSYGVWDGKEFRIERFVN